MDPNASIEQAAATELTATSRIAVRKELQKLPEYLGDGEYPVCMAKGALAGRFGLVVVTEKRMLFIDHARIDSKTRDFWFVDIGWVTSGITLMGYGALRVGPADGMSKVYRLKILPKERAKDIADAVAARISSNDAPEGADDFESDDESTDGAIDDQ